MISALLGLGCALIGIALFIGGFLCGKALYRPNLPAVDADKMSEQRQALIEEQAAFKDLLGYNTDIAYQMKPSETLK